ncbi:hypothetical protein P700755_002744 [Psychroflexus torquis ATCC 700755]|uniref:Uncharacterized protein n=1 Tax=Psychroflexus torquis (strain ATCC 700755 / CIP 106069 / ACAM 623) TaxID=313595 RepID=K4IG57_PSYTT|nr:hypothetical protein [Psychroflexus torquis]AFU69477.1 hypothetical protein P700755_002744 [Psychroflexus torquis ATCC 700755]
MNFEIIFDYKKPIANHFSEDKNIFICLFPFYHQIFADHYSWESNIDNTFKLLRTETWNSISNEIGFNSTKRLVKGILELDKQFQNELVEFCDFKKIDLPDYAADKIPEVILIPFLKFLRNMGVENIETVSNLRFPDAENKKMKIQKNIFDAFREIEFSKHIKTNNIEIILPDYDCPYCLIVGNIRMCLDLIEYGNFECLRVNANTKFDWWD